jgi:hypothetical protein
MSAPAFDRTTAGFAIGFAATGWALLALLGPIALFLTWWGDCLSETCPAASGLDRTIYLSDLIGWLVFPALAVAAYRGWRPGWAAIAVIGFALIGQAMASFLGVRGFNAFAIVLPSGLLIAAGGLLGLAMGRMRPRP